MKVGKIMKIEVEITNTGWNEGTSKWLADRLKSGELRIVEMISKRGTLGLYLNPGREHIPLAGYEFSGHPEAPDPNFGIVANFGVGDEDACDYEPSIQRRLRLTDAAALSLRQLALSWAESKNMEREDDTEVDLRIPSQ